MRELTTIQQVASEIDGTMAGFDIPPEIISILKKQGMIVVFGDNDDNGDDVMEIDGAISGKFSPDPHVVLASGKIMPESDIRNNDAVIGRIEPRYFSEGNPCGWDYRTDIPHVTFRICYEDADVYCVGMVIDYAALLRMAGS